MDIFGWQGQDFPSFLFLVLELTSNELVWKVASSMSNDSHRGRTDKTQSSFIHYQKKIRGKVCQKLLSIVDEHELGYLFGPLPVFLSR